MPDVRMKLTCVEFLDDEIQICIFEPSEVELPDESGVLGLTTEDSDDIDN